MNTNISIPEAKKPEQIRPETRAEKRFKARMKAEFDILSARYTEKLQEMVEAFAIEMQGDESEEDTALLNAYDARWRLIANNVNHSRKPIRLQPDAFINRVKELMKQAADDEKVEIEHKEHLMNQEPTAEPHL